MISAIAVFQGQDNINGTVKFFENGSIIINLSGLKKNSFHGFHVHEYGDLSDGCNSACAHFNPFGKKHGCPGSQERHVGDLGNIQTDIFGNAKYTTFDDTIKLYGECNIKCIIHEDPDDCGQGQGSLREESLKTGNSGKRIACAVIGYSKSF